MNAKEFFDLVVEMRRRQKIFFGDRCKYNCDRAKYIERKVDAEIDRVEKILSGEPSIFKH